jgi:DNA-binding response OmpR family regulator
MKILIIEDDEILSKALKMGLEKEGYAVDCLHDGESGQRRMEVNHQDYDVVVLDLMLPKRNGFEVCANLRALNIVTPIIILTGKDDTSDKIFALDAGADDYLTKPFSIHELSARIRALLRRPKVALPTEIYLSDITLNTSTRQVFRNGKEVPLTLKEFGVLEYLMRHPNQVVKRDQILDHVWDFDFNSFSNIVDVHINNLRKKINADNSENFLETIRGIGYRFKVAT